MKSDFNKFYPNSRNLTAFYKKKFISIFVVSPFFVLVAKDAKICNTHSPILLTNPTLFYAFQGLF